MDTSSLWKQIGCFNHRVVTLAVCLLGFLAHRIMFHNFCQRHTLQIHCSSSFISSLCTTVECSYRECVHLTQVCSVVWAGGCCPAAPCAAQIIGSNVESEIIDCLTAARGFTPLHSEAFTGSKADTYDGRGWGRGWRGRNHDTCRWKTTSHEETSHTCTIVIKV